MMTEDCFTYEGTTYHAVHQKTCRECAFEFTDPCIVCGDQPYCMSSMRQDGEDVVWQEKNNDQ
jgi:hypothetical protein